MARTVDIGAVYAAQFAYNTHARSKSSDSAMRAAIEAADEHRAPAIKEALGLFIDALQATLIINPLDVQNDLDGAVSKQVEALRRFNDVLRLLGIEPQGDN